MKKNAKNLFTLLIEIGEKRQKEKRKKKRNKEITSTQSEQTKKRRRRIYNKNSCGMDINLLFIYQCLLRFLCVILHLSDVPSSFFTWV